MKTLSFLITLVLLLQVSIAQIPHLPNKFNDQNQKDGLWTVLFDSSWNQVKSLDSTKYYRVINYSIGKPVGLVKDFYMSGKIQWEGRLKSDDPEVYDDGECTFYYENGNKQEVVSYLNGKRDGHTAYYYDNGRLFSETLFHQGYLWSVISKFDPNGKPLDKGTLVNGSGEYIDYDYYGNKTLECNLVNSLKEGKYIDYYNNGKKESAGEFKNDYKHGPWKEWHENGKIKTETNYSEGLLNGVYCSYYDNGNKNEAGQYVKDQKNGIWSIYYEDGSLSESGAYIQGEKYGPWKEYYSYDDKIKNLSDALTLISTKGPLNMSETRGEGMYNHGNRSGDWIYYDKNNTRIAAGPWGEFDISLYFSNSTSENDTSLSSFMLSYATKLGENAGIHGMKYMLNVQEGKWSYWYEDGKQKKVGEYHNDKKNGKWCTYLPSGLISSEGTYVDDVKQGTWSEITKEGLNFVVDYIDDKIDGNMKIYSGGKLSLEGKVKDNRALGTWKKYSGDGSWEEGPFDNYIKEGEWKGYDKNGKLVTEGEYRNDVNYGIWKLYLDDGGRFEGGFLNGKMNGVWKVYDKSGNYSHSVTLSNGVRVD